MPKPYSRFVHTIKLSAVTWSLGTGVAVGTAGATLWATAGTITAVGMGLTATGVGLVIVPLGYAIYKATPWGRRTRRSATAENEKLSSSDFNDPMKWDCYWMTTAVVGCARTGKTQLKRRLMGMKPGSLRDVSGRTLDLEIHLARFSDTLNNEKYLAILDHRGAHINEFNPNGPRDETDAQVSLIQKISRIVRVVIVVADHADTFMDGDSAALNKDRLDKQQTFLERCLIHRLGQPGAAPNLRAIFLVLNKRDVWDKHLDESAIVELVAWAKSQQAELAAKLGCDVHIYRLSALDISYPDYGNFKEHLGQYFEADNSLSSSPIRTSISLSEEP
jgi:hypothetical protein